MERFRLQATGQGRPGGRADQAETAPSASGDWRVEVRDGAYVLSLPPPRPWHPYGAASALQDCPDHGPNGVGVVGENTLSYGNPVGTHDTRGWPIFKTGRTTRP